MRTVGAAWIGLQERHAWTVDVRYARTVDMRYARTVAGHPPPPPPMYSIYQISRSVIEMYPPYLSLILHIKGEMLSSWR
jgi:hypothetical protein